MHVEIYFHPPLNNTMQKNVPRYVFVNILQQVHSKHVLVNIQFLQAQCWVKTSG